MSDFETKKDKDGFTCKLWRGERMTLLGFDVAEPEQDLVGFAIEYKGPADRDFQPLCNRIAFSYDDPAVVAVNGSRNFNSRQAPFQKFRWIHFPSNPVDGRYVYRVTKKHMPRADALTDGTSLELGLELNQVTFDDWVDVEFQPEILPLRRLMLSNSATAPTSFLPNRQMVSTSRRSI